MKAFLSILFVLLIAALLPARARAQVGRTPPPRRVESFQGRPVQSGEIIVRFRQNQAQPDQVVMAQDADIEAAEPVGRAGAIHIRSRGRDTAALMQSYASRADVLYVQPNYLYYARTTPNDPFFDSQYALYNHGQTVNGKPGLSGADIKARSAWDITMGSRSVVIGIVDTGVNYNHPDLAANIWSAPSAFSVTIGGKRIDCPAGSHGFNAIARTCDPLDSHGHGTHVAGIAGAVGNNGIGTTGVSPIASIMALEFLSADGSGTTADAIAAIDFAIQVRAIFGAAANVRVLNNSWGGGSFSQALQDEINLAAANDILFVVAAGNDSSDVETTPDYPSSFDAPNIISVAATDNTDTLASFSNYGTAHVQLAAPGVSIDSTLPPSTYTYLSGTSMASPMVAGAAALVLSACPLATTALKANLLASVDPLPGLSGKTATSGRLNVFRALSNCYGAPPQNFTLAATPAVLSMNVGDSANIAVNVAALQGFNGTVSLSISNLPPGLTASFSPSTISEGGGNSTLTLTAVSTLTGGTYTVTILGTSGALSQTLGIAVIANALISNNQTLSGSLTANSPLSKTDSSNGFAALYTLQVPAAATFTINSYSAEFTPALNLLSASGTILARGSLSGSERSLTSSLVAGTYIIEVTAGKGTTGDFVLAVNSPLVDFTTVKFGFPGGSVPVKFFGSQLISIQSISVSDTLIVSNLSNSNGAVTATITIPSNASPGPRSIVLKSGPLASNAVIFYVYPAPPSVQFVQPVNASLTAFDNPSTYKKGIFGDFYSITIPLAAQYTIAADSPNFDPYLVLISLKSEELNSNVKLLNKIVLQPGTYIIEVTSIVVGAAGNYTLNVLPVPQVTGGSQTQAPQGGSGTVILTGNFFSDAMTVTPTEGVTFGAVTRLDFNTISFPFTVDAHAVVGGISHRYSVVANGQASGVLSILVTLAPAQMWTLSPSIGSPGRSFTATFTGDYLVSPLTLNLGSDVTASNLQVLNPNLVMATITIAANAAPGVRPAALSNTSGSGSAALSFTVTPPALTVSKTGTGGGRIVTSPAGVDCGPTCWTSFAPDQKFDLVAVPDAGSIFSTWSGDSDCIDGSVTMSATRNCIARFDQPQANSTLLRGDYDGDGKTDIAVYRPSTGEWFFRLSTQNFAIAVGNWYFQWGTPGDVPLSGDFDGDGKSDIAVYRPSTGEWFIRSSTFGYAMAQGNWYFQWGVPGDVPITGDFDGDGKTDISVYRPSTGEWYIRSSTKNYAIAEGNWYFQWGQPGDQPIGGDFDGDGKTDITVYRPSTGEWYIRLSSLGYAMAQGNWYFQWGQPGDQTVAGDFDGDRKTDIAVYRPITGEWFLRLSKRNYAVASGNWYFQWGQPGDLIIRGDFDGDLLADIAVYRPPTGEWYIRSSTQNYAIAAGNWYFQWGQPGDVPFRR